MKAIIPFLIFSISIYSELSQPSISNEAFIYTVDGLNDCTDHGTECTSLNQATEAISTRQDTSSSDDTYTVVVETPISDGTERPIVLNHTIRILQAENGRVSISNDTTYTSVFITLGCNTSVYPIDVTLIGLNFSLAALGVQPDIITGNLFKVDPTAFTLISFTVKSLSIIGSNPLGIPAYSTVSVFDMAHGTLTLDAVTISSIHIMTEAAIKVTGGSLYTKNHCFFHNIASYNQEDATVGGAVSAILVEGSVLNIAGTTFELCSSIQGGGAINMIYMGECSVTVGGMKYNEEVIFRECSTYGLGGAMSIAETVNVLVTFNRIEYVACNALAGTNMFFTSDGLANLTYYIMQMDEVLKGQHTTSDVPYDFIAQFKLDATSGQKGMYPLYALSEIFACLVNITQTPSGGCEVQNYPDQLPIDLPTIAPGTFGSCPSLQGALSVTDSSNLPCGNTIFILPSSNLQPSNFTGTAHLTVSIVGGGNTITLGLTDLLSEPMITVGPGIGRTDYQRDRVIMFTITDATFTIQRTETVYLRQSLFKINNQWLMYNEDMSELVLTRKSESLHYLELNTVKIISGNDYNIDIGAIAPSYSIFPFVDCADDTVLTLKYVTFSNLRFMTFTDLTGTTKPSIFHTKTATLIILGSTFENITLDDAPLFEVNNLPAEFGLELPSSAESTTIDNINTFRNIIRLTGSGSIVSTSLAAADNGGDTTCQLAVTNAYFTNCNCLDGNGGVVYIGSLDSAEQAVFDNLLFSGCSATIGSRVYVMSDNVTADELALAWPTLENDCLMNNDYQVKTGLNAETPVFDHLESVGVMMVDVNRGDDAGTDAGQCGSAATIPCKTIYMGYTNRLESTTTIVLAPGDYQADIHPITLISTIHITGGVESPTFVKYPIKTVQGGVFVLPETFTVGTVSFSKLTFQLLSEKQREGITGYTESTLTAPVISSNSPASIVLTDVIIEMADVSDPTIYVDAPIASAPIVITAGSLLLDAVVCQSITMDSGSPFITSGPGAHLTLRHSTFQDITLYTRNLIDTSSVASELVFEGTNETVNIFRNIHRLSGHGACFHTELGGNLGVNFAYCAFINCTSDETDEEGRNTAFVGAVYLTVASDDGILTIDPETVSFSLTASPTSHLADDGTTLVPDFDASFNAPWKSAITIASNIGSYIGTATSGYASVIADSDPAWKEAATTGKYNVIILDDSEDLAYNNTMLYSMSENLVGTGEAEITPTGGDLPGCGLSGEGDIPCATVQQAMLNLKPTSNTEAIIFSQGTHRGRAFYGCVIDSPVTITGTYVRGLSKSFVTLDSACFTTSSPQSPPIIQKLTITISSGGFVVNTGDGGVQLDQLTISGYEKATVSQRLQTPFISSTAGNITLSSLVCRTITLKDCLFAVFTDGAVLVKDSIFTSIVGHSPGTGGTVISSLVTTLSYFRVINTTFTSCHSQGNGGALSIAIRTSGVIDLDTVTFTNCDAVGNGGAIYILASQKYSVFSLSSVVFEGATGDDPQAAAAYGSYMLYQSDSISADVAYLDVEFIVREYRLAESQFMVNLSTGGAPLNMYALQTHICIGGKNANEERSCGSEAAPCTNLVTAMDCAIYDGDCYFFYIAPEYIPPADVHIRVHRNLFIYGITETTEDEITTKSTILVASVPDGVRSTRVPIEANADDTFEEPLFNVLRATWLWGNLELNMTNVRFAVISSELTPGQMKNPFLRAVGETVVSLDSVEFTTNNTNEEVLLLHSIFDCGNILILELYNSYFNTLTINDSAVLNIPVHEGSDFTVNSLSTFEYITRKHGNGAVLSEVLTKDSLLTFSNVEFIGCVCEDGCGGAVYIDYQGGRLVIGDYEDAETGAYEPTRFINCSASEAGGACYFDFSKCEVAPAVSDVEGEEEAENLFLLQNTEFSGINDMTRGKYAYAAGKTGVVDDITLWKYLIPLSSTAGEYQFYLQDAQDESDALQDIYSIIPSVVTVNPFREDGPYCAECNTIGAAMQTYASFATHIILDFTWRDGNMPTSLFHTVLIVGVSTASIIYLPNTHQTESVYFVVDVPRTVITLQGFNFIYNKTDQQYPNAVRFVLVDNGAKVIFNRMKFTDNTAGQCLHAGSVVDASNGKVEFANCAFDTITLDSHPLLAVSTKPDWFIMEGHNLFNTIVQKNTTFYTHGTIIDVTLEGGDGVKINGANFSACTTSTSGALLYFTILDNPDEGSFVLSDNYFFAAGSTQSEHANRLDDTRIAIIVTTLSDYVQASGELWTSLVNKQDDIPNAFVWLTEEIPDGSPIPITEMAVNDLRDFRYYVFYVDGSSTVDDRTQCEPTTPCPYLHYAADLSNKAAVEDSYINVAAGTLNNEQMKASFLRSCTVAGSVSDVGRETTMSYGQEGTGLLSLIAVGISKTRNEATVCTIKDFLVTVTSTTDAVPYVAMFGVVSQFSLPARLILDTISFSLNTDIGTATQAPLETPLITASTGCLTLTNCDFTGIVLKDDPLIDASPAIMSEGSETSMTDLEFTGSNSFTSITRNEGYGAVFHFELKDNAHLMLSNSAYSLNSATIGGCIYIKVAQNVTNASYAWDSNTLSFNIPGTYENGAYMYIDVESLEYFGDTYLQMESDLTFYQADLMDAYVLHIQTAEYNGEYQFYEVQETLYPSTIVVSDNPGHFITMRDAIEAFNADKSQRRIFLKRDINAQPLPMDLSRDLSISGLFDDRSKPLFPITGLPENLYTVVASTQAVSVTVNSIDFRLNSTSENPILAALFTTSGERATLITAQCIFETVEGGMSVPMAAPIFNALEGTLGLSKCKFQNLIMASTPLITLPSIKANFGVYATCTFENITRNTGNGAVFEETIEASDILTVNNVDFINCHVLSGHGGVAYITLRFRSLLQFERLTFTGCTANGSVETVSLSSLTANPPLPAVHPSQSNLFVSISPSSNEQVSAKGGALYIFVAGQPDGWTISNTNISSCTASGEGRAFYLDLTGIDDPGSALWSTLLEGLGGAQEGDLVALVNTDETHTTQTTQDLYKYTIPRTTVASTQNSGDSKDDGGVATWIIIVIAVAAVVAVAAGIALIVLCCRKSS